MVYQGTQITFIPAKRIAINNWSSRKPQNATRDSLCGRLKPYRSHITTSRKNAKACRKYNNIKWIMVEPWSGRFSHIAIVSLSQSNWQTLVDIYMNIKQNTSLSCIYRIYIFVKGKHVTLCCLMTKIIIVIMQSLGYTCELCTCWTINRVQCSET